MLVIGEKINATNKSVGAAIASRDADFITNLAKSQDAAGANYIDVNAGSEKGSGGSDTAAIEWLVEVVQAATQKPLTIDSESPDVIEAGLKKYTGTKPMINSISAEKSRLEAVGALAAKYEASLVALAMGDEGIPETVEKRLEACVTIMTHLQGLGMPEEQVYFDPLVLPISVDSSQGMVTLNTIQQIKARYPAARTTMGLSNISFGLPERKLVNRSFLLMAAYAGLDAAILDPLDARIMSIAKISDLLTGKDANCRGYLRAHRRGAIVD